MKSFDGDVIMCNRLAPASTASLARCVIAGISTRGVLLFAIAALAGSILEPMPPATNTASSTAAINTLTSPLLSSVAPHRLPYGRKDGVASLCRHRGYSCRHTFTDLSPEGPWNDSTFTSGSLGLIGLMLLYLAWFRLTFETNGVVPTMDLWKDPEGLLHVIGVGLVILGIAYAVGRIDFFPEPAGLILSLIGLLTTTNGVYVWMSTAGPLSSEEE